MYSDGSSVPVIAVVTGATEEEVQECIDIYLAEIEYPREGEKAPEVAPLPGVKPAAKKLFGEDKKRRDDELREKCRAGATRSELAEEYNLSLSTVSIACRGIKSAKRPTRQSSQETKTSKTIAGDEISVASVRATDAEPSLKDGPGITMREAAKNIGEASKKAAAGPHPPYEPIDLPSRVIFGEDPVPLGHVHVFEPRYETRATLFGQRLVYLGDICYCGKVINVRGK